jgi:hypothetical protein
MHKESNPWCAITSAENELGMEHHSLIVAPPRAQIRLTLFLKQVNISLCINTIARRSDNVASYQSGGFEHFENVKKSEDKEV